MNTKHLMLVACAVSAFALSSCKEDPLPFSVEEEYTRNFIKTFGIIDPKQDWNFAKATEVNINVGKHADVVKVYCKVDGKYYIVANLNNVEGDIKVPIDIPKGSNDLYVKVDGKGYHTTVGKTLNVDNLSRGLLETTSTTHGTVTVTASEAGWMYFNAQQIAPITADYLWSDYWSIRNVGENGTVNLQYTYRENPNTEYSRNFKSDDLYYNVDLLGYGLLPELNAEKTIGSITGNSNVKLGETEIVAQDFTIDPGDNKFIVYPMYWNSSQKHTLGIYLIDADGDALNATGGKASGASDIAKFPIYEDKGDNDIQMTIRPHVEAGEPFDMMVEWTSLPSSFQTYLNGLSFEDYKSITGNEETTYDNFSSLMEQYASIGSNSGVNIEEVATLFKAWYNSGINVSFDENHKIVDSSWTQYDFYSPSDYEIVSIPIDNRDHYHIYWGITFKQKSSGVPNELIYESGATWVKAAKNQLANDDPHVTDKEGHAAYYTHLPLLMRSKGIEVDLGSYSGKIGMYIEFSGVTHFSEKKYNPQDGTSYAVSYKHPMSDRVYFSFEDWNGGSSDYDFNDLIFLIDRISKVSGTTEIIVESTPDPDNPNNNDNDDQDNDTPVSWIIAAEDLGATDDFDFNDVVFKLTSVTVNIEDEMTKQVTIKALAAGGTLPVYLHYVDNNGDDFVVGPDFIKKAEEKTADDEWHKWFGTGYPTTTMINTGIGVTATTTAEVTFSADFDVETYSVKSPTDGKIKGFYLEVNGYNSLGSIGGEVTNSDTDSNTTTISGGGTGQAPQMFLIRDNGWRWPKERERIFKAYPSFNDWVKSAENTDWTSGANENFTCRPVN